MGSNCSSDCDEPTSTQGWPEETAILELTSAVGDTRTMYHATSLSSAHSIIRTGEFRPGDEGYLGPGIYFCKSREMAMMRAQPKSEGKRVVLELNVQMGRMQ